MDNQKLKEEYLTLYDELSDPLFRHCYFRVSNRDVARDMVQDTFIKTWQYIAQGKDIGNLKAFLYKVANNLIIDYYRKKKSDSLDVLEEEGMVFRTEDDNLFSTAEASVVLKALQSLEDKHREIIVMRFLNEMSPREIGEILGQSENAVSVRLNRALKKYREVLNI